MTRVATGKMTPGEMMVNRISMASSPSDLVRIGEEILQTRFAENLEALVMVWKDRWAKYIREGTLVPAHQAFYDEVLADLRLEEETQRLSRQARLEQFQRSVREMEKLVR